MHPHNPFPTFVAFALLISASLTCAEESVKPGINEKFLDPQLRVEEWLTRFETESREVFTARDKVLEACEIQPGNVVADVGAGTGLYTHLFAQTTGPKGWVYAVDINPRFLEHIQRRAKKQKTPNITAVLCPEDSVSLPRSSVDVMFICDTYHHFEYPHSTAASMFAAIRPGGSLVVIDFERIPGVTREWILNHVRAGKEVFKQEILDAGFVFEKEIDVPGLEENYFLRFRKPAQ